MTKSNFDWVKGNLEEGLYQGVASSAVDNLSKALLKALEETNVDPVTLAVFQKGLEDPMGKALLSLLVGSGVHFIPLETFQQNKHLQKVADKCVQNASSEGVQQVVNLALKFVLPALTNAISNNPQIKVLESIGGQADSNLRVLPEASKVEDAEKLVVDFASSLKNKV